LAPLHAKPRADFEAHPANIADEKKFAVAKASHLNV
jgi:hypothetical protein